MLPKTQSCIRGSLHLCEGPLCTQLVSLQSIKTSDEVSKLFMMRMAIKRMQSSELLKLSGTGIVRKVSCSRRHMLTQKSCNSCRLVIRVDRPSKAQRPGLVSAIASSRQCRDPKLAWPRSWEPRENFLDRSNYAPCLA